MPKQQDIKITVVDDKGREHNYEGQGRAVVRRTTTSKNEPRAILEVVLPLDAEWDDTKTSIRVPRSTL